MGRKRVRIHDRYLEIASVNHPLELRLESVAENDSDFEGSAGEIIPKLSLMNAIDSGSRLHFNQEPAIDHDISSVSPDDFAIVVSRNGYFALYPMLSAA